MILVYGGGPIDYRHRPAEEDGHEWRHRQMWDGLEVYCPICENVGTPTGIEVMARNFAALDRAEFAVFDLSLRSPSIGTPIEAWEKMKTAKIGRVVLVHPHHPGVFVQDMIGRGAVLVTTFGAAAAHIHSVIANEALST